MQRRVDNRIAKATRGLKFAIDISRRTAKKKKRKAKEAAGASTNKNNKPILTIALTPKHLGTAATSLASNLLLSLT